MLDTLGETVFSSKLDELQNEFYTVSTLIKLNQFYVQ